MHESIVFCSTCTMSSYRKFTFAISSPDESLLLCLLSVASPAMGHYVPPSTSKSESQLSKYCVDCEIMLMQMSTLSISRPTALVTKLSVIEQLLHPAPKSTVSAPWRNFNLCPSSQQILAPPLFVVSVVYYNCLCNSPLLLAEVVS